jgi:pimeloyl-ACP methyl ester carboxylesterase
MRELLPTAVLEMQAILDADSHIQDYAELKTPTLMLSGGWSPAYFAATGRQLAAALPQVDFAIVPLQFHEGPLRPGKQLAARIARYLAQGTAKAPSP